MTNKTDKETPVEWRERVLNSKSKSFCGAKWYNATIWLGNGATVSCHLPPPHKINRKEIQDNPSALHNTTYKKLIRKQMQEGIRPKECDYCWKIEDLDDNLVSDRYYKSKLYTEEELESAHKLDWKQDVTPRTLEIAFDSNCNFGCSYCNAGYSTTWAHDIKKNGPYQNLISDGWAAFAQDGDWAQPYGVKNEGNPYTEAFWKWWESDLQYNLKQLRVTGGEATVSHDFWKLIDWFEKNPDCPVDFAINSNLGIQKKKNLDRLVNLSKKLKSFKLFTSNESFGTHAEYIRDGLKWDEWLNNYKYCIENGEFKLMHCMLTLNALSLFSLDKFHETIFDIREEYKWQYHTYIDMSYNLLRFPSFQSIVTLPKDIREERAEHYTQWLQKNRERMHDHEIDGMERTIAYIVGAEEGHNVRDFSDLETRQRDFVSFYRQYDKRRNKNFEETFSDYPNLVNWYKGYDTTQNINPLDDPVDGDATKWGKDAYQETITNAWDEGLL